MTFTQAKRPTPREQALRRAVELAWRFQADEDWRIYDSHVEWARRSFGSKAFDDAFSAEHQPGAKSHDHL